MAHFTSYNSKYLVALEARAFALLLPRIAHVHTLAFTFRASLLDLVLDSTPSSCALAPSLKKVTILIVEEDVALRAQHKAVVRTAAPNATILCAGYYPAACDQVLAQEEAGSPVHLVLAGACVNEACAFSVEDQVRAVTDFMDAIDPHKGTSHIDMRERPLTAAILSSAPRGAMHRALWGVVDAALPEGRVTASALHILLDFVCERHLGGINATKPPSEDPIAVAMAQASEVSAHIWVRGTPVPTPVAARIGIASGRPIEDLTMAAAQAAKAAAHIWVRWTPVPTPVVARIGIASGPQPAVQLSGQLRQPLVDDTTTTITPVRRLAPVPAPTTPALQTASGTGGGVGMSYMGGGGFSGAPMGGAIYASLAPLPPQMMWHSSVRAAPPPQLAPVASAAYVPLAPPMLRQSSQSTTFPTFGVTTDEPRPAFPTRRASFSAAMSMFPTPMFVPQPAQPRARATTSTSRFSQRPTRSPISWPSIPTLMALSYPPTLPPALPPIGHAAANVSPNLATRSGNNP